MAGTKIPHVTDSEAADLLALAAASPRRRHPKILHAPGDVFNRVINAMLSDSYMQPHLHPGDEKIEHIYLIRGRIAVLFFDDEGRKTRSTLLEEKGVTHVAVPAFTWHTYVILSESAITYETMMGEYAPKTWKEFAQWAPVEGVAESAAYLETLRAGSHVDNGTD